ncbi:MAG: hypothetical protein Q8Q36_02245 [bacterium]|nr:hypothetical protein [bacterium]
MNNNTAIIALVVLLIIVGGFLYFSNRGDDGAIGGNNGTATTTEENGNEDEDENGAATTTGTNGGASTGGTLLSSGAALSARTVLASRLNTAIGNVTVTDVEAATWPNGCLGLARMGEVCTQALVEGYRVTLSSGGQTYVYRTNSLGTSVRLEQ